MSGTGLHARHLCAPQPMPSPSEVIVIHDNSPSQPDCPPSTFAPEMPAAPPSGSSAATSYIELFRRPVDKSAAINSSGSITINPQTPPLLPDSATATSQPEPPAQPRYMTRSVAQNAARRKQEQQQQQAMAEMLRQQRLRQHECTQAAVAFAMAHPELASQSAAATTTTTTAMAPQHPLTASNNPYTMMPYTNSTQQQGTWTSTALYQAARAVAAAGTAPTAAAAATRPANDGLLPPPAKQPKTTQQPAAKRRKNAAAVPKTAAAQRSGRGRATQQRTAKQQQKGEASCDDREGHYIVVPGREFTPRFRIRRLLGQGTFGKVMECEEVATGRLVAIKVIRAVPKYRDAAKIEVRVLQTLERNDPSNAYRCMHINETFDHRNHVCMVFDLLGPSVFDFLKENEFRPFSLHHVQLFAEQLLRSVAFLHSLNLVHTDLKPENILLESGAYDVVAFGNSQTVKTRMLRSTAIRLIDFGSATFNNEYHSQVVSTRHYRAPEIILNLGWSFPCDMWSVGCIILELLTGEALFQTHDNNEHLAMMEAVIGRAPPHIVRAVPQELRAKFFRSEGSARYPAPDQPRQSQRGLRAMRALNQMVNPGTNPIYANLHDLLLRLLQYDPRERITAKDACNHPFFRYRVGPDGRPQQQARPAVPKGLRAAEQQHQQQQAAALSATTDLVPSPSSASLRPSFPASAAAAAPALNPYAYHAPPAATASGTVASARAPLRVADYSLAAPQQALAHPPQPHLPLPAMKPTVSGHVYRDPVMSTPHSPYKQDFAAAPRYYHSRHPAEPPQQQGWHYAQAPVPSSATLSSSLGSGSSGYEPAIVPQQQQTWGYSGKRKAGVPIDSGYFPDLTTSSGESSSAFGPSAQPSPTSGAYPPQPQPQPQQRSYLPAAGYSTAKGCNLPPLHGYHQQRHPVLSTGMAGVRLLPLDAKTTPTLTMATTATPTPNSTSHLSGSHSVENVVPSVPLQQRHQGRSLPSLALPGPYPSDLARHHIQVAAAAAAPHKLHPAPASPVSQHVPAARYAYYNHIPPPQGMLQPQHHAASLDTANYHHFAPPSANH